MRVVLIVQYDGTNYCGWQIQPNGITVQEVLETRLMQITGERINLVASGRTDSGVHAVAQVAHFDTECEFPSESYAPKLNAMLCDEQIKIVESFTASEGFHARYSAKRKTYQYKCYESRINLPLKDRYSTRINRGANFEKMVETAKLIEGEHDFKCFCSVGSSVKDTVRKIYSLKIEKTGDDWTFTVCGNGFLYNMVRIIVGTLFAVGYGKISQADVICSFENGNRDVLGKTMPPNGLTLLSVEYENS